MSYTVESTFTKPADKKWFAEIHPRLARKFARVDRARAIGLESRNVNKIDENTVVITSVWASQADYQSFLTKRGASIADGLRQQYAANNGITVATRTM